MMVACAMQSLFSALCVDRHSHTALHVWAALQGKDAVFKVGLSRERSSPSALITLTGFELSSTTR
jgi:hypothetical protein